MAANGADGYWLSAADGGMFAFGDAPYFGSLPGTGLCKPPHAERIVPTETGKGYWIVADDGSIWSYGNAKPMGSIKDLNLPRFAPIVGFAATH